MAKVIRTYGDTRIEHYSELPARNPYRDEHGRYTVAPPSLYETITLLFAQLTAEIGFFTLIGIALYGLTTALLQTIA